MTVNRWKKKNDFVDKDRKRKSKLTKKKKIFLLIKAANKYTGINNASCRKLAKQIKYKFSLDISPVTVNNWLRKLLKKPIKAKTTFLLKEKDKNKRIEFSKMIKEKKIIGKQIFFTDEKRFIMNAPLNRQTNQIRLDNKGFEEYKRGFGKLYEKVAKPLPKFSNGVMVAAGVSYYGPGKLIFVTGTMNSFSYAQTLKFYREDIERLNKDLFFQQDNASCHTGKKAINFIKQNFNNSLEFWPANSPDLSPIEQLWAIVEDKLNKYTFNNIEEMIQKLQWIRNRIPKNKFI